MGIASRMQAGGGRVGEPGADIGVPVLGWVLSGWGGCLGSELVKVTALGGFDINQIFEGWSTREYQ